MNSNTNDTASGSRTATVSQTFASPSGRSDGVLQLRASASNEAEPRRVIWSDDTVDNEHMGKKKSKICCIYHKPKDFDESSEESSASSSEDSDSDLSSDSSIDCRRDRDSDSCLSNTCNRNMRRRSPGDEGRKAKERDGRKLKASKNSTVTTVQSESKNQRDSANDSKDDDKRAASQNAYEMN